MLPSPFDHLPQSALQRSEFSADTRIFGIGDPASGLFYLESGSVKLVRYSTSGDEIIIHRSVAGDTLAEASLFSDRYHCDAWTDAPATLIRISKKATLRFLQSNSEFARLLCARFAHDVQTYRRRIELLSIRSAEQRVLVAVEEGLLVDGIRNLAGQIGLTPEATYRALSKLAQHGSLQKTSRGRYLPSSSTGASKAQSS